MSVSETAHYDCQVCGSRARSLAEIAYAQHTDHEYRTTCETGPDHAVVHITYTCKRCAERHP